MTDMEIRDWLDRYWQAWEKADADAVAELFTENASYRNHVFRDPHVGRPAIRAYWERATATQSDIRVRAGRSISEGNRTVVEWWTTMREVDEGEITLPGCLLLRFSPDGFCEDLREYWHFEKGLREPPPGWGE